MTTQAEYEERRERWAKALESGEYAQTKSRLRDSTGYCCLGVACDLYGKETGEEWQPLVISKKYVFMGARTSLPEEVQDWLGLRDVNGVISPDLTLVHLNDTGSTFAEIAAIIRSAPTGLFLEPDNG